MFLLNSNNAGQYDLLVNGDLTVGANSIIPLNATYSNINNYYTVTCSFTFIPTQADPTIAFDALFNVGPFADPDQISGSATVSLVTSSTGSDGNVLISSSSSSSSVILYFNTPGFDSSVVYECQAIFSYFAAPESLLNFVSSWTTPDTIKLPLVSSGTYDFYVDWGDGSIDHITAYDQPEVTHTYAEAGDYIISIDGTCQGWSFLVSDTDQNKITNISQWGNFQMGDGTLGGGYFYQCTNLTISAIDVPDLTGVYSFDNAFQQTGIVNIPLLDQWIVSDITSMSACFAECSNFIGDGIENWDMRNVTNLSAMFIDCIVFNAPIGLWVVESAIDMSDMLNGCTAFTRDLNGWDTSEVINFTRILRNCINFNGNVSTWNTASAFSFVYAFNGCTVFDQDLSGWNVTNLTDATSMLDNSGMSVANYSALLIGWAAQTVQNSVPFGASNLQYSITALSAHNTLTNDPNDWVITDSGIADAFIATWDTEALGELSGTTTITLPLISSGIYDFYVDWGDGNVDHITAWDQAETTHDYGVTGTFTTQMAGTIEGIAFINFYDSSVQILEISNWGSLKFGNAGGYFYNTYNMSITATDIPDISGITSFNQAFWGSYLPTGIPNIDMWDVSAINDMTQCFKFTGFDGTGLNSWNVTNVTTMSGMFHGSAFNTLLDSWITTNCTDMSFMFAGSAFDQDLNTFDMTNVTTISGMLQSTFFNSAVDMWELSSCIDASNVFNNCPVFNQNLFSSGHWHTPLVQNFSGFLLEAASFNQPMDDLDVSSCKYFVEMFRQTLFNQPLPSWNTQSATNFNAMFRLCPFDQDISSWDLSNGPDLTEMWWQATQTHALTWDTSACSQFSYMFAEGGSTCDISSWNMSSAINLSGMFYNNTAFNIDIGSWDVSNVTDFSFFMQGVTTFDQALPWTTTSGTTFESCFDGCTSLNSLMSGWTISGANVNNMFRGCTALNQPFSSWITSAANSSYHGMFDGCTSLDQNFGNFNVTGLFDGGNMFNGVTLSNANYNLTLYGFDIQTPNPNIGAIFTGGNSHYDTTSGGVNGVAAHDDLTNNWDWIITDGGTP